ncbi:glutamyl-tRNA amidotransferase subunit A [Mycoplasmopsis californica HAZ160_1]|uniref:Glutamyl-tRNA amidotransferase subunit A n=1 Tax=Mycoplasmopsis californica HAZ160_1 TaxID=1397850 RepID=A0AAT9F7G7_9BACT|nr:amidase family protein [Mycoplasmopsis californica]BAP00836.1 glutamyl-tRNA amidotransferase subunit A [Mycoplasmopsis californica HAZ160_1]BBG40692.1 glutamyl-tRNA amidotransferase subunit A [Mycoplasmopsis californica]BBG41286.1 glutamyl-tRNA amidotransferase subunit A [Mycoplasmopsis californica]BBG41879.1 glutamyl-tRNA amidotransferase subunit A [Mycoplasmopsis californica]BBG42472.1 glutamyl-tRNA amidotransferase subunit A [Mycoplasmopsis californica]
MELKVKGNFSKAQEELKNDKNNAVAHVYTEQNTKKDGILSGAVFTIKDVFATKDVKTTASSKILETFNPGYNATPVQKLLDAGATPVGKVYNDELALGGTGTFSAFGLIKNPIDNLRLAGGSSSGSTATLTKNVSFALASDTGDSVRLPASYNSQVGFKPSYGAISRYGMFAYASSLDTVSYFAHNVNDIALLSQVMFGVDSKDFTSVSVKINDIKKIKPSKIAILDIEESLLSEFVFNSYKSLIKKLKNTDITIEFVKPDKKLLLAVKPVYDIISYSEASSNLANLNGIAFGSRKEGSNWEEIMTNTRSAGFGTMVQRRLTLGSFFLFSENQKELFLKAQQVRRLIKEYWDRLHEQYDLVIYPASADIAPYIDSTKNKSYDYMDYILTTSNLAGLPSITLPWIKNEKGLGVNITLETPIYSDEKLLSYSLWMEDFLGGENE